MSYENGARPGRSRIDALDVIRGFALCGILVANVRPIAHANPDVVVAAGAGDDPLAWLGVLVDQRFFPIFSLLFGVGFSLMLESAERRSSLMPESAERRTSRSSLTPESAEGRALHPRVVLLRRLLALLALGLAHMFLLWRGDILTIYAVVGLVALLPSTWLPRWSVAALAGVLLVVPLALSSGGVSLVPGLFLLGSSLTRYGVIDRIEHSTRVPALLGLAFAVAAAPALWLQTEDDGLFTVWLAVAGLLMAGAYVCVLLVLLRTPLRPALLAVFAPLGRMALTNYLSATVLVLLIAQLIDGPPETWDTLVVLAIAAGILTAQRLASGLWLRRHRHGPMEWLWRWATWGRRP